MHGLTFELIVVAAVIVLVNGDTVNYYATKYDHLDIERILNNRRMVNYYAQCLLGKGPCTPQGLEFKRILPEALETNCLRCTEKQRVVTYRTIKRLKKEYPKVWAELQAQWDPNDTYVKLFEETYINLPSSTTSENEINLDDRFGVAGMTTKKSTTKFATKKPQKGKYPPVVPLSVTTQKSKPLVNNMGTTTQNRPVGLLPYNPNFGGNVSTNQVGDPGSTKNDSYVLTTLSSSTVNSINASVNTQPPEITSLFSILTNIAAVTTPNRFSVTSISDAVQAVTQISSNRTTISTVSPEKLVSANLLTSKPFNTNKQEGATISLPSRKPLVNSAQAGISFDIPPSSISNSLTVTILQNSPITANIKPVTAIFPENPSSVRPVANIFQSDINSVNGQPDVISQVLASFLNNNRPSQIGIQPSVDKTIPNGQGIRSDLQVRLPSISVNAQAEVFNPVGNFVRDITTVGGRLIETGTSIADTLLSSVRSLFTPPGRASGAAQTRL